MSEPAETPGTLDPKTKPASKRLPILVTVLMALLAVAVVRAVGHRPKKDALHSAGMEKTPGLLETALRKMPENRRLLALLEYVQDPSPGLRYAAVDALGHYDDPQSREAIELAFKDSSAVVRERAQAVLPLHDPERGLRLQLAGLQDEDNWIREYAAMQLMMCIGKPNSLVDRRVVPALMRALDDEDANIPPMATGMLVKLTGRPWRLSARATPAQNSAMLAQWRQWWDKAKAKWPTTMELAEAQPIRPTRADPAPPFALRDVNGHWFRLEDQKGRVTLLNFWGTWCPPCQAEIPDLVKLDLTYRGHGLDIIGVALGNTNDELTSWCKKRGVEYRQALATNEIRDDYGEIDEVPVSVLIDKQGRVRYRWEGERDFATFNAAVDRLLRE